jgi:hypothetical protein
MLPLARRFGDGDLRQTRRRDAIYFNPIARVFIHYSSQWVLPLLALAWAIVLGAVIYGARSGRLRIARAAAGLGFCFANILVTAAIVASVWVAARAVDPRLQPGFDRLEYDNGFYMIGFTALALAIGAGAVSIASRWAAPTELGAGGLAGWLLLATVTSIGLPAASYLFTWPVFFGSVGLFALLLSREAGVVSLREAALLGVSAAFSLFLLVPTLHGMYTVLALPASGTVMAFVALVVGLLSPQIAAIVGRTR